MRNLPARVCGNYLFLVPLFAIALLYQITYTIEVIRIEAVGTRVAIVPFTSHDEVVDAVSKEAEKAGLRSGDRVLSVNGSRLTGDRNLHEAVRNGHPGDLIALSVIPKGETAARTIRVPLAAHESKASTIEDWVLTIVLALAMLLCAVVGIYAAAVRPNDLRALFFFGLMLATSQMITSIGPYDFPHSLWALAFLYHLATVLGWGFWLILFALYFPERFEWDIKRPWIKFTFLAPYAVWMSLVILEASSSYWNYRAFRALDRVIDVPVLNVTLIFGLSVAFFCAALGFKLGTTTNRDARRRLRLLIIGSSVSLIPVGCLVLYNSFVKQNPFSHTEGGIIIAVVLLFCIFPGMLGYVVVTERAMELRMVIRQGMRYALARGGMRVLISVAGGLVIAGINILVFGTKLSTTSKYVICGVAVLGVVLLVRKTRKRTLLWVDRRFFREAYNAEQILEELSDTVRSIAGEERMIDTVARRISESLHVSNFAALMHADREFRPVYCLGFECSPSLTLPAECKVVDVVKQASEPPQIYFDRQDNWIHTASELELVTLKALNAQLLLPVGTKENLVGILSLGPKLSEEPYSRSDVRLLRSVALQTGLAIENARLTKAVATEMAEREKMNREMEIAREVQERLFPQRLPAIAGIDYSGACRPALGVGGDYYDFLPLQNGDLGIAIGDVSGKGIAAALLMASLQASLRGQALMGQGDLAGLMANVNQLVYDATPPNRYATFFYGQYHRAARLFRYVNAGHNPPIVLRRTNNGTVHVIRLDTGGPVVGLFPSTPYQEGSLTLEPGDLFVGFTDGISEAMNGQDEEWGEERLIPAVAAYADRSAAEIIPSLMAEADRFASGAPQHDDMTLVVVKMSGSYVQ
jgi:sigma-B regulation protein RsbU (phosphoserine phosphatase)